MDTLRATRIPRLSRIVLGLLAAALVACGGGGGGSGGTTTPPKPRSTPPAPTTLEIQYAADVFDRTNAERVSRGVAALTWDDGAAEAAFGHAFDMADRDFFDHTNPDGEDPGARLSRAGVFWDAWGENIAEGQPTPEDVVADWMASPDHRDNILSPLFTRLGVGVYLGGGSSGPWWVQDFFDDYRHLGP